MAKYGASEIDKKAIYHGLKKNKKLFIQRMLTNVGVKYQLQ